VESQEDPRVPGVLHRRDVIAAFNHEVLKRDISAKAETFRVFCSTSSPRAPPFSC
jgi:CIC family chloride channel protein